MDLNSLTHWHWWILAVALVILEVFAPGTFFIWMGAAAAIVGIIMLVAPQLGWEYQFMVFSILSVVSIAAWKVYQRTHPTETDRPTLNRRGEQYVGRTFNLTEPIVNGMGKIRVDDSTWKIEGADCAAGTQVRVTGVEGTILMVEKTA